MPSPLNPVVVPRLNAAAIAALGTPQDGWLIWDTDDDDLEVANGGAFAAVGGGGGAPTGADYLVGTAQGGLSAEIVVGTSPGGELGGTWASPTVDASHSGSTHAAVQAAAEATAASALATHEADTTSIHGIANTANLLVTGDLGVTVQGYDADLAAIAALTSAANKAPYSTGAGTWALADLTAAGRALIDDADAAAQLVTLGVQTFIAAKLPVQLPPGAAVFGDGSTSNVAPGLVRLQGTQTGLKTHDLAIAFSNGSVQESCWWTFIMPDLYASGGSLVIKWIANATSGSVQWFGQVAATTAADADTPLEHALSSAANVVTATNTTEANRLNTSTVSLNMDSAAAGDLVRITLGRNASGGSDDLAAIANVLGCAFTYA